MGIVPSSYKEANVSPVPKKGDLTLVTNYRPISLLNSEAKVFEWLIFKHLYNHIRHNKLLTSLQSGFIPGDSTINQLTFLYNTFCQALDSGKEVRAVFCNISKVFDRLWHVGLCINYELLVSQEKSWPGSKAIFLTETTCCSSWWYFRLGIHSSRC